MEREQYKIVFYKREDGTEPVREFLDGLDHKMWAKMQYEMDLLQTFGRRLREPYSKPLGDGIFELRAQVGTDISRVLYFFIVGSKIVITNGFVKKTQKTPASEIKRAKKYRDNYLKRSVKDNV